MRTSRQGEIVCSTVVGGAADVANMTVDRDSACTNVVSTDVEKITMYPYVNKIADLAEIGEVCVNTQELSCIRHVGDVNKNLDCLNVCTLDPVVVNGGGTALEPGRRLGVGGNANGQTDLKASWPPGVGGGGGTTRS